MKATKTIAALCAIGMAVSTMALPVQAKTSSKMETEVITMDDTTTTNKSNSTTKSKTTTTKKSKSSQVSWKNAGKALKCTVKTEEDFYKAYSNAIRLNAPTLKVTFDKSYKGRSLMDKGNELGLMTMYEYKYAYDLGMSYANAGGRKVIQHNDDYSVVTIQLSYLYWGTAFPYAYNTGDTSAVDDRYKTMYKIFSKAADDCTETTDLGKAEYAWNWVIDNMVYDMSSHGTDLPKSFSKPTSDGKYKGVCEDYANAYILLMRMLDVPCWQVSCYVVTDPAGGTDRSAEGGHAIVCAQINGEFRYFDPTFGESSRVGKQTFNMTVEEAEKYYSPRVNEYEVAGNAAKSTRKLPYSELEKYFIW